MNNYSFSLILIILIILGGKLLFASSDCKHKYINAVNDGRFVIVPTDTVDNRPTYTVIFEDDYTMDHMYAEEIAESMIQGRWHYNECARIIGE